MRELLKKIPCERLIRDITLRDICYAEDLIKPVQELCGESAAAIAYLLGMKQGVYIEQERLLVNVKG